MPGQTFLEADQIRSSITSQLIIGKNAEKRVEEIIRTQILNAVRKEARKTLGDFKKLTKDWSADVKWEWKYSFKRKSQGFGPLMERPDIGAKPTDVRRVKSINFQEGNNSFASYTVFTYNSIFKFLNKGTEIRHKPMASKEYVRRTSYGSFEVQARGSVGKSPGWSYGVWAETHGIAGREWTIKYAEKADKRFREAMEKAVSDGLRKAGVT